MEQIVVERRVVPVERVRVSVDRVLDEVEASTTVQRERIDVTSVASGRQDNELFLPLDS